MTLPEPEFMTIQETSDDQKMPVEVIQWFIEAGHLNAYVPTPSDHYMNSKEDTTIHSYSRAKDSVKWLRKGEGSLLNFKQMEILNQEGKINKIVRAAHVCLYNEVQISTYELFDLQRGLCRKSPECAGSVFKNNGLLLGSMELRPDKKVISKIVTNAGDSEVNGAMLYPEPDFITLQETPDILNKPFKRVKWFVEYGHLNAYVPTPSKYNFCIDGGYATHQYARAKDLTLLFSTGISGVLGYNQLEILNQAGVIDKTVSTPHACEIIENVMISTEEIATLGQNQSDKDLPRTREEFLLETKTYAENLKAKGHSDEVAAVMLKSKFPRIYIIRIGRLFPANSEREISDEGARRRGQALLKRGRALLGTSPQEKK